MGELRTLVTAEQLAEIARSSRAELVRGEVIERVPVGRRHGEAALALGSALRAFVRPRRLGKVFTEVGMVLGRDPDVVRAPDIAFISAARLVSLPADGYFEGAPDLAVEILSPEDRASEVLEKVREYLEAGARMVWVLDPRTLTVTRHLPAGEAHVHAGEDLVPGDPVLPGFSFRAAELLAEA